MTTHIKKPVVQFSRKIGVVIISDRALLHPIDHKSNLVSNTKQAMTSLVLKTVVKDGRIVALETQNTKYMEYNDVDEYLE